VVLAVANPVADDYRRIVLCSMGEPFDRDSNNPLWVSTINVNNHGRVNSKGCFFKFGVEVGVGESIEIAPLV
jgi:hypothetical protein